MIATTSIEIATTELQLQCYNTTHAYACTLFQDRVGALQLQDGSFWGQPADQDARLRRSMGFQQTLRLQSAAGLFAAAGEDALPRDEAEAILQRIHDIVEAELPSSSLSRFAQGWALRLSDMLSRRLETAAWEAPPPEGLVDVAAPAPGYHDAAAFPELDVQPIPQGIGEEHLLAALQEGDAKSAQQHLKQQEQEQAMAQAMKGKGDGGAGVAGTSGTEAPGEVARTQEHVSEQAVQDQLGIKIVNIRFRSTAWSGIASCIA